MRWVTIRSDDGFVATVKAELTPSGLIIDHAHVATALKPWETELIPGHLLILDLKRKYGFEFPETEIREALEADDEMETWH